MIYFSIDGKKNLTSNNSGTFKISITFTWQKKNVQWTDREKKNHTGSKILLTLQEHVIMWMHNLLQYTSPACQHSLLPAVQVSSYLLLLQPVNETQRTEFQVLNVLFPLLNNYQIMMIIIFIHRTFYSSNLLHKKAILLIFRTAFRVIKTITTIILKTDLRNL